MTQTKPSVKGQSAPSAEIVQLRPAAATFLDYADAGFAPFLIPIAPPGATLSPKSGLTAAHLGKIPAEYNRSSNDWRGMVDWTTRVFDRSHLSQWQRWPGPPNIGLRTGILLAVDLDCPEAPTTEVRKLAGSQLGRTIVRGRGGSPRQLMLYRLKAGEISPHKGRVPFRMPNDPTEHAVEFLGQGGQFVSSGTHPSGNAYHWVGGQGPVEVGFGALPEITAAQWSDFIQATASLLEMMGYEVGKASLASGGGDRLTIPCDAHRGDPAELIKALAFFPNDKDGEQNNDSCVQIIAAFKAGMGGSGEEEARDWYLRYSGNETARFDVIWQSISESTIGADWLYANAREHGYDQAASDFAASPAPIPSAAVTAPVAETPILPRSDHEFLLERLDDIEVSDERDYIIKGVLDQETLAMVYGEWGKGKSFVCIDLGGDVATDQPWFGHKVQQFAVIYVAAEGGRRIRKRFTAWKKEHGVTSAPFYLLPKRVNMRDSTKPDGGVLALIRAIERIEIKGEKVGLIIIDTLHRALAGGSENEQDVGQVIDNCAHIRDRFHATVILVHHQGKDPRKGARGTSAAPADVDTMLRIEEGKIINDKARDNGQAADILFRLKTVKLRKDVDGDWITSCVVVPGAAGQVELEGEEWAAHMALKAACKAAGKTRAALAAWKKSCADLGVGALATGDRIRQVIAPRLKSAGWVRITGKFKSTEYEPLDTAVEQFAAQPESDRPTEPSFDDQEEGEE